MSYSITPILSKDSSAMAETLAGEQGESQPGARGGTRLGRGAMLGRYIVLDTLGRGGMGIVYAAYDPELDRKVAVKLLLPGRDGSVSAQLRLQREAQAIARLAHPNVVAVHDVGTVGNQVFITMELVEGIDLARWLEEAPRSQAERLDCFMQAGAGLAAAHAADLVHRDFKPENVLMGRDGRARVVDFGLVRKDQGASPSGAARVSAVSVDDLPEHVSQRFASHRDDVRLTDAGSMVGTPAYMSPEQFMGLPGDARSDQFSFCVALYEALYGERPFAGDSPPELSYAVCHGELRPTPSQHEVSGRVRRVLVRGLDPDPEARYPSMEALLGALRKAGAPQRRRWLVAAGLVLLGGGGLGLWATAAPERTCAHRTDRAALVWNAERRAALEQAFEQTGRSYAADTWVRVQAHLDAHVAEWAALQTEVCESNEGLDATVAAEDPRQRCLDERLDELGELLSVFDRVDGRMVTKAVPLAYGLGATGECAQADSGTSAPIPSEPALREQVDELRSELRRLELQASAGLAERDPELLAALVGRAEALGYSPLMAEMQDVQSGYAAYDGDFDRALELSNLAFETALSGRHDVAAFRVAADLAFLLGVKRREPAEAHRWARRAEALRIRTGSSPRDRLSLLSNWASIYAIEGDDEHAQALYDEALVLAREQEDPVNMAGLLNNIGAFHAERDRLDLARQYIEEALERQDDLLGPDHPSTLRARANLGIIAMMSGHTAEGRELLEAVLPRQEVALGSEHPEIAVTLEGLSSAYLRAGELEKAEAGRRRVLEIRSLAFGPHSQPVRSAKDNLAGVLHARGRYAEAYEMVAELLAELDPADADPRARVSALENIAESTLRLERPAEALKYVEEAQALCRSGQCTEGVTVNLQVAFADAKLALGERQTARETYEAVSRLPPSTFRPWVPIRARFGVARAMLEDDPAAALELARRALAEAEAAVRVEPNALVSQIAREIEAWLREHG